MKSRKGDIPITILVIGVFAVCTLAMLSFFAASISSRNSFVGVDIIEDSNKNIEKGELNKFPIEVNKSRLSWDYVISGFKDELLFSIDYEKP